MKRLIVAIAAVRAKLAEIELALEEGDEERALELVDEIEQTWREAIEETRHV